MGNSGSEGRRGEAVEAQAAPQHPRTSNTTAGINGSALRAGPEGPSARHAGRGSTQEGSRHRKKKAREEDKLETAREHAWG